MPIWQPRKRTLTSTLFMPSRPPIPVCPFHWTLRKKSNRRKVSRYVSGLPICNKGLELTCAGSIVVGPVKEALLEAARHFDADVLMIGRSPQSGVHGRLRDLTYAIVRESPFPVLSI